MITEKGKAILGKYLTGQNDSTFSYIALGVGAVPAYDPFDGDGVGAWALIESENCLPQEGGPRWHYSRFNGAIPEGYNAQHIEQGYVPEYDKLSIKTDRAAGLGLAVKYSEMKELDFEVLRVPITESGVEYVQSQGKNKYFTDVVLTATVPSFDHYKFTEIGIYSAESNAIETSKPSQMLFKFSPEENWLGDGLETNTTTDVLPGPTDGSAFYPYNNENFKYFSNDDPPKSQLYSETRVGSWCLALKGVITNNVQSFGFGNIRPTDEFRVAYFINPDEDLTGKDVTKSITITFTDSSNRWAKGSFRTNQNMFAGDGVVIPSHADFGQRYAVGVVRVADFSKNDDSFSWKDVRTVKIEKAVLSEGDAGDGPDVILDALRFVSTNYNNPNYGLIAYSVVQNRNGSTPDNFEFRLGSDYALLPFPNFVIPEPVIKQKGLETLIQYRVRISESLNGEDYVAF